MKLVHAVAIALSLPEAHEEPHHGIPSYRVSKKIFATAPPGDQHLHVFVEPDEVHAAVASAPDAFEPLMWGQKLAGVRVVLANADPDAVEALLASAWRRRASKAAVARLDGERGGSA